MIGSLHVPEHRRAGQSQMVMLYPPKAKTPHRHLLVYKAVSCERRRLERFGCGHEKPLRALERTLRVESPSLRQTGGCPEEPSRDTLAELWEVRTGPVSQNQRALTEARLRETNQRLQQRLISVRVVVWPKFRR